MTQQQLSLDDLGLVIVPTPAMLSGEQSVWQHAWCGTVVVLPGGTARKRPPSSGGCPGCDNEQGWWRQELPVAGVHQADPQGGPHANPTT